MTKAKNLHVRIASSMSKDEVLDKLARLGGAVLKLKNDGMISFRENRYGSSSINVAVTMPLKNGIYHDKFSVGTATRNGETVLRIGPSRKALLPWKQMVSSPEVFSDETNWTDLYPIDKNDSIRLKLREKVQPIILNKIKDVIELGNTIHRGKKTNTTTVAVEEINPGSATGTDDEIPW